MSRTITKTVYQFSELSDSAKEKARDWYRSCLDSDDWTDYEDYETCARLIGITIDRKSVRLMGGGTRQDPAIYYSGFSSQGDGACFEGRYAYVKGAAKAIRAHAGQDKELHRIADTLQALQRRAFYGIQARMTHSGRYQHSGCMSVDVWQGENEEASPHEADITKLMRDFADWIYRQLEAEHDYRMSDEAVDEAIECNEYEFYESGKRAG